jgi:hypothetical protein
VFERGGARDDLDAVLVDQLVSAMCCWVIHGPIVCCAPIWRKV